MPEKQNIEWKESWKDEYLQWVSGFANANGGSIYIGKNDFGKVIGLPNYKKLMDDLPNKIKNGLGIVCEINLNDEQGNYFIEIIVESFSEPISYRGKFYLRSGSTNQLLNGTSLKEFLMKTLNIVWDETIVPNITIEDIDLEAIQYFKQKAIVAGRLPLLDENTSAELILKKLDLINGNGAFTRACLILFGKNPKSVDITAYLKIGRFGDSNTELLAQDVVECSAINMADKAIEILDKKYIIRDISYDGLQRVEKSIYPFKAIREVLFNSIIHRTYDSTPINIRIYDDRIRIWNIGELPKQLTIEDLKTEHDSIPRNKLMANTFYKAGLIETWGRGTITIIEECKKHGLLEPLIEEKQGGIAITIFSDIYNEKFLSKLNLNERQKKAIQYIKKNKTITSGVYQDIYEVSKATARRDILELVELKIIKAKGEGKLTEYLIDIDGYKLV